jgi:two-component system phosphate regulon sensor histidine kinase PhoR
MPDQVSILVIDDEQIMREGCSRILCKDGWAVITAENGKQGLNEIQACPEKIDVILLDLMMPGMSGMEVLDHVRTIDPNLLVIVITGYATVESAVEAMKKGAYDFIPKPFTPDQLRIVVRRALERRTLQKEAEFLRRERERSLRDIATEKSKIKTIINCMGDGVLVCDRDSCIVLSNPAASRMLKVPETSLLGNLLPQCNLHSELSKIIQESLNTEDVGYTSVSQELSIGESGEVYLRAHTAPVRNDIGETMGSVTVLQDISHLKELDKMKSEFIAMVAHELRAPIAAVEQPLFLQEVIQRVVDLMRAEAEAKKIDLQFSAPSETPLISADRNSMEGIFTNLISNAIKYTPEGGTVWVTLCEEGGFLKAAVSDTGIGIKKEDLSRIFDKFYRVKTIETRQVVGTGLGLSIVKSIVDAHLGSISVESEEGGGATFTVLLPKESMPATCGEERL